MEKIELHPSFDVATYIGDVAILTLTGNMNPLDAARLGIFPAKLGTPDMVPFGTYVRVAGWGVTNLVFPQGPRGGGGDSSPSPGSPSRYLRYGSGGARGIRPPRPAAAPAGPPSLPPPATTLRVPSLPRCRHGSRW